MAEWQDVVDLLYNLLYNKSVTNRNNGVWGLVWQHVGAVALLEPCALHVYQCAPFPRSSSTAKQRVHRGQSTWTWRRPWTPYVRVWHAAPPQTVHRTRRRLHRLTPRRGGRGRCWSVCLEEISRLCFDEDEQIESSTISAVLWAIVST